MHFTAIETPLGLMEIGVDDDALVALDFVDDTDAPRTQRHAIAAAVRAYFHGDLGAIEHLKVRFDHGTPFQQQVWRALRTIPLGETISYAELARRVDRPSAFRAVGSANGQNPIAVVVPCHRVIAADGTLGGYGGGLDKKRWLLAHEGVEVPAERVRRSA
ncbi:MAG: methylated-DNA--[protein]-cysteine S-methyltransferase [Actinobacteria bacterium]|nr:methylated-DNA--[protein]-cysteine S-methyltransferase [Actinomycetota bacterium]